MSDGNYNRQLLPKTDLSSGLRAGKAQMRQKALQALDTVLDRYIPDSQPLVNPQETKAAIRQQFMQLLRQ